VCGEYVSNESAGFFLRLGLRLGDWDLPQISALGITSGEGYLLSARLGLGGFGISRYKLDAELAKLAASEGVHVLDNTSVQQVNATSIVSSRGTIRCKVKVGAFGKAHPHFTGEAPGRGAHNYIGVKYHIRSKHPASRIELHNFRGGYCGISRVEDDRYCLCYLTHSANLTRHHNDIQAMEDKVLKKNPRLKKIFDDAEFIWNKPLTVSNVSFGERRTSDDALIYVGDAAGCISPLTGNGMSMSGYASFVLCGIIQEHLAGNISRDTLAEQYRLSWRNAFALRIRRGRQLQYLFGKPYLSALALRVLNPLHGVKSRLIASTHGIPY
jgi:flavin-dependent dehydrogenase